MKGRVASIIADDTTPESTPNVRTIFFIVMGGQ
jgi:hypothetical protein